MSISTQHGLVGFFDILGYQQLICNNDIIPSAQLVSELIVGLADKVKKNLVLKSADDYKKKELESDLAMITSITISDSIVLFCPLNVPHRHPKTIAMVFTGYCSMLLRSSFDIGLPLRGAIDKGDYYHENNCFAGEPIINAYKLAESLPLSGAAITNSFAQWLDDKATTGKPLDDYYTSKLLFPMAIEYGDEKITRYFIDWFAPFKDWGPLPSDLRDYVHTAFLAHNKDLMGSAVNKADMTEISIRKSVLRTPAKHK